jgi:hypothetical protein
MNQYKQKTTNERHVRNYQQKPQKVIEIKKVNKFTKTNKSSKITGFNFINWIVALLFHPFNLTTDAIVKYGLYLILASAAFEIGIYLIDRSNKK